MQTAPGTYFGTIREYGVAQAQNEKKTPFFWIQFEITHQHSGCDWSELATPIRREVQMYLSEGAWDISTAQLRQIGFNGDFKHPKFDEAIVKGGLNLECKHETHDGKTYEKWSLPPVSREKVKADTSQLDLFNAKWKKQMGDRAASKPKPVAAAAEEDVPF